MASLISSENAQQGTLDWMLSSPRIDPSTPFRCPWIEGYCAQNSVRSGEQLDIYVSTNPESSYTIDLFRLGYYGGKGARRVGKIGPLRGRKQEDPPEGERRLRECRWEASTTFTIPKNWLSGVYLGKMTAEASGVQSYIILIVSDDREADFVFKCSDTTWHAYNRWPAWNSIYDDGNSCWFSGPEVEVSYDRPYTKYATTGDKTPGSIEWHNAPRSCGSGEFLLWEFPTAYWMESRGYDVTYVSSIDVHTGAANLRRTKGLLSVGHDEYYTIEMYQNMLSAIEKGLSIAFLSGNTCLSRIALEPNASGRPHRRMRRIDRFGPCSESPSALSCAGDFPFQTPSEALLIGAHNISPYNGGGDWICACPDHWIYAGTGMQHGDRIPGLVGWEWHGDPAAIPGLAVVAAGKTESRPWDGSPGDTMEGAYTATVYPGPHGNVVFNASTIWWGDGLSEPPGYLRPTVYTKPKGPDPRVQRMMENVLGRMKG